MNENPTSKRSLPSIVYVLAIPLGIILFIGAVVLAFTALATIEGIASIIFLLIGFAVFRPYQDYSLRDPADTKYQNI